MSELICVVCQRRETRSGMVCDHDRTRLARTLDEIVELYATLDDQLVPGRPPPRERLSGKADVEAALPLNLDPLDLTMPARAGNATDAARLHPEDQIGSLSVASRLDFWVQDWRSTIEVGSVNPVPTVWSLARWLRTWLQVACDEHGAIDDFADEMFKLAKGLRVAAGVRGDRVKVGKCPIVPDEGERACGATLTADPYLDVIRCPKCDTQWTRDKWIWLGLTIRAA